MMLILKGLWLGIICALVVQVFGLALVTIFTNWDEEVKKLCISFLNINLFVLYVYILCLMFMIMINVVSSFFWIGQESYK